MKKHQKHAKITKPTGGHFHQYEIGFVGAPCSTIQNLCEAIAEKLGPNVKVGYVDAEHKASEEKQSPYYATSIDKIKYQQFNYHNQSYFHLKRSFAACDVVLVNGNHYATDRQIVIINSNKKDSLERKLARLNNVTSIILDEGENNVFPFLTAHIPAIDQIKQHSIHALDAITDEILESISSTPIIEGIVLSGGKSQRMGEDKGEIQYHNKTQREYLADLFTAADIKPLISIRQGQSIETQHNLLIDSFVGLGPFGAILSAFREDPNTAKFTLPCDAPFVDQLLVSFLLKHRNPQKVATCFYNPETKFPEPLLTIWEPRSYSILLEFLAMGYSCPRKVLINSDVEVIQLENPQLLFNANTADEKAWALGELGK